MALNDPFRETEEAALQWLNRAFATLQAKLRDEGIRGSAMRVCQFALGTVAAQVAGMTRDNPALRAATVEELVLCFRESVTAVVDAYERGEGVTQPAVSGASA